MSLIDSKKKCCKCDLFKSCKTQIFGEGNPEASVVFVGEAPGAREDSLGRPFVGEAGKTLRRFIKKAG